MEKRIIGIRFIDVSHGGPNITDRVSAVIEEFKLIIRFLLLLWIMHHLIIML